MAFFVLFAVLAAVLCVPGIFQGYGTIKEHREVEKSNALIEDHREAQEDVRSRMRELRSVVESPQGD